MTPPKSAADYAAIAVAPLLIFLMISSLANFLMLILYHGGFPQRVSWTLLMFTLGAVGIARVAIEQDRAYALGYASILGAVAFIAMLKFADSPIFSAFILVLIAYLADVIVRDCTLIDDDVDASGQGLVDSGRLFLKEQVQLDVHTSDGGEAEPVSTTGKTHQPGRTVMYLAFAALPLFGLGQFFLRNTPDIWARAQMLLAFYLFASLSLLVTTSFLGLRRYLRQRRVEMPRDVSIAWLAGGLAMVAAVLSIAFLAPLPGKALATFELPAYLDSPGTTMASRFGWGQEGADQSNPDAPGTTSDPNSQDKEIQSTKAQEGAPPGDVGDGNREDGPPGERSGGKQTGGEDQSDSKGEQQSQSDGQQPPGEKSDGSEQSSKGESSSPSKQKTDSQKQSDQPSGQSESESDGEKSSDASPASDPPNSQSESENNPSPNEPKGDDQSPEQQDPSADDQQPSPDGKQQESQEQNDQSQSQTDGGLPPEGPSSESNSSSPSVADSISDIIPATASLLKFVIFLALAGIVGGFLWFNRHLISQWWDRLFGRESEPADESFDDFLDSVTHNPPRAFASFRNPVGKESDLRRIVVITFQAFEAWTREHGAPRDKDETPSEFIRRVTQSVPQLSAPASQVVDAYNRIVYGRGDATNVDVTAAKQVWQLMQSQS